MASRRRATGEGSLYFDKSKDRWVGSVVTAAGRRKVLGKTKTEARQRLDKLRHEVDTKGQVGKGNATVNDAVNVWTRRVLAARTVAPSTRRTYEWCASVISDELGSKRLRTLTVEDIERAFDRLADPGRRDGRPFGRAALVKLRSVLGQALDTAQRRGMVNRNVARIAELTPDAKRADERMALTPEQVRMLCQNIGKYRVGVMVLVMLTTGLRPGEASGVLWDDLNLDVGTLTVRHAVRLIGNRPVVTDELKTASSRRTIALPKATIAALRMHRVQQSEERLAAADWSDLRLVFATTKGTPLSPANVRRDLEKLCRRADVPVVRPNELRHSAASAMSDAGVPLEQIADQLGHTSTRMLDQTYRHRVRPAVTASVDVMDALLAADES
jgi:integrase